MGNEGLGMGTVYFIPMVIGFIFMGISWFVSNRLKSKFNKYSKERLNIGLTGKQIAEKMLEQNGIYDVQVLHVKGQLTDHYNPVNKTVNLSESVYNSVSVAATAVSAHEVGHAVQHATAYKWLGIRSKLVPIQNASGMIMNIIVMATMFGGAFLYKVFPVDLVLYVIIAAQGAVTLFAVVTLPVEFDASNRALAWIENNGIVSRQEHDKAKDALKWAAMTYVVAALAAIANLVYWVVVLLNRRD
ncbi:MAG: zinc metallopeptidase [Putridiphycobacter sp.]|nr:zinc metallopeptidase [Putridiphycobacter sp.]